MPYLGEILVETIPLVDGASNPISGATFPPGDIFTADPNGAAFDISVAELGEGNYRFTVQTTESDTAGNWYAKVRSDGSFPQTFELEWTVERRPYTLVQHVALTSGATRKSLRRSILSYLGDLVISQATAPSGNSQWIDEDNLAGEVGTYASRELHVTDGTPGNIGQVRRIGGSNRQFTLQLTRTLPFDVQVGDEAEITNTFGNGVTVARVHQALNRAISNAGTEVPIAADIPARYNRDTRTIEIPPEFTSIDNVQFKMPDQSDAYGWREAPRARTIGGNGWFIDKATRSIYVGYVAGYGLHDATIRLTGYSLPQPLDSDNDVTAVPAEWLVSQVCADLLLRPIGGARGITPEWERKGFYFDQEADRSRDLVRVRRSPNVVRL